MNRHDAFRKLSRVRVALQSVFAQPHPSVQFITWLNAFSDSRTPWKRVCLPVHPVLQHEVRPVVKRFDSGVYDLMRCFITRPFAKFSSKFGLVCSHRLFARHSSCTLRQPDKKQPRLRRGAATYRLSSVAQGYGLISAKCKPLVIPQLKRVGFALRRSGPDMRRSHCHSSSV